MLEFRTPGFKGFSTKYSPFFDSRMAVATGQHFGIVGNGRLYILGLTANGIQAEQTFDTQDTLYDLAWSETHENQLLVASGDGSVKLYDISVPQFPIAQWRAHGREVYCVHWNLTSKRTFLSASWDGSVKVFRPERPADDAHTVLPTHSCTYSAQFSPHDDGVVSAVSADGNIRIWDLRTPASASNHLMMTIPVSSVAATPLPGVAPPPAQGPPELLTHDWNKYRPTMLAAAGVDRVIRTFDLRNAQAGPVSLFDGHRYAVRKVAWSPHLSDTLLSASYDMSCAIWSDGSTEAQQTGGMLAGGYGKMIGRMERHTEFCTGVDWTMFGMEGWCASTGWDERVLVWDVRAFIGGRKG